MSSQEVQEIAERLREAGFTASSRFAGRVADCSVEDLDAALDDAVVEAS
jgi:hypothetical protein